MKLNRYFLCSIVGIGFLSANLFAVDIQSLPQAVPDAISNTNLIWDSETKATTVDVGEPEAHLTFNFTNTSSSSIMITNVHPSCGCTTAQLPPLPWIIAPGTNGKIGITVNLAGKSGTLFKSVTVSTDKGSQVLSVKIAILPPVMPVASITNKSGTLQVATKRPAGIAINQTSDLPAAQAMFDPNRARSFQMAAVDRQAVFKGDCASCHVNQGKGKFSKELYDTDCGICHEGANRATMVPNLHAIAQATNAEFWRTWISYGRPHSLMPAFATTEGGPLTDEQIATLVDYLRVAIPLK